MIVHILLIFGVIVTEDIVKLSEEDVRFALNTIDKGTRECNFDKATKYYRPYTSFYAYESGIRISEHKFVEIENLFLQMMEKCSYEVVNEYKSEVKIIVNKDGQKAFSLSELEYDMKYTYGGNSVVYREKIEAKAEFQIINNQLVVVENHWKIISKYKI
ncbi:hypothetical protein [Glaciecola sp. SC05]|uniref:hypothetical protein n=1 Tax=Glaciecola sp. SC05 TaxID=1987355 RepID=UPI0035286788